VHGLAESGEAWRGWVPHFARQFRVIRLDLRGFGRSTPMVEDFGWSLDVLIADIVAMIEHLGDGPIHLIGAKSGGSLVLALAARRPDLVSTLVAVTPPVKAAAGVQEWIAQLGRDGVHAWAGHTMAGRLGSKASAEEVAWWVEHIQGKAPKSTLLGYLKWVPQLNIRSEVEKVRCPTLVITTSESGLRSPQVLEEWQRCMPDSQLLVLPGDAWHAAGAYPDRCAKAALNFITAKTPQ
jgi:3-oxoadipate enol-lactonase